MSDSDVQWPLVKARLVELAPTLPGWDRITVFPGPVNTNTLKLDTETMWAAWATFGYTTTDESGTCQFEQDPDGFQQIERGTVHCELTIQVGDTDPDQVAGLEAFLFAALSAWKAAVRADRTLGVLSQQGTATFSIVTAPVLTTDGAAMFARFVITYLTVT